MSRFTALNSHIASMPRMELMEFSRRARSQTAPNTWNPQKMSWWYWALLDEMVARPQATKKELADHFKVSYATVVAVTGSDIFLAHYEERRRERSARLDGALVDRLQGVALKALDAIETHIEKKRDAVPLPDLTTVLDKTLTSLGYGPKSGPGVQVNVAAGQQNVVAPVSIDDLEAARKALRRTEATRFLDSVASPDPEGPLLANSGNGEEKPDAEEPSL